MFESLIKVRKYITEPLKNSIWRIFVSQHIPCKDFLELQRLAKEEASGGIILQKTDDTFSSRLENCGLYIGRSGEGTVAEILAMRKPAVFIPYIAYSGNVMLNEQYVRAKVISEKSPHITMSDQYSLYKLEELACVINNTFAKRYSTRNVDIQLGGADKAAQHIFSLMGMGYGSDGKKTRARTKAYQKSLISLA